MAFSQSGYSSTVSRSNYNLEVLIFVEGGKPENPAKNPPNKDENQQQTQPTCDAGSGNLTRPQRWEVSALTTAPSLLPFTPEVIKPDPTNLEAVLKMERPSDVAAVRRLVGLVNYWSKFSSKLSELCELLRRLTHKGVEWRWSIKEEKTFESVRQAVTSVPVLRYFNFSEPVEAQGDASNNDIGFVLIQNGQPTSYSPKALTTSEGTVCLWAESHAVIRPSALKNYL